MRSAIRLPGWCLQTTRNWTDTNNNFIPDCDLSNPADNGECRAMANPNFGKTVGATVYDPETLRGWNVREFNWEFTTSVQHQLAPRVSVDVGYFRRWYGNLGLGTPTGNSGGVNFITTDDRDADARWTSTRSASRHRPIRGCPTAADIRCAASTDLKPTRFGLRRIRSSPLRRTTGSRGRTSTASTRPPTCGCRRAFCCRGASASARRRSTSARVVDNLPEMLSSAGTVIPRGQCHAETPFLAQFKMLGSYTIPKYCGTAERLVPEHSRTAARGQSRGAECDRPADRSDAICQAARRTSPSTSSIQGRMYGDRLNQLDVRVSKLLNWGRRRTSLNLDVYNAMNSNRGADGKQRLLDVAPSTVHPGPALREDQRAVRFLTLT